MTLRTTAGPLTLARTTLGGPREIGGKLRRLLRTARLFADRREVERRLEALAERGYLTCSARLPRDLRSLWRRLRSLERFLEAPAR